MGHRARIGRGRPAGAGCGLDRRRVGVAMRLDLRGIGEQRDRRGCRCRVAGIARKGEGRCARDVARCRGDRGRGG
ncbi:MAG: hypothetical protein ACK56I_01165, partial [bacterium]